MILKIKVPKFIDDLSIDLSKNFTISGYNDIGKTFILKAIYATSRVVEFIDSYNIKYFEEAESIDEINDGDFLEYYKKNSTSGLKFEELTNNYVKEDIQRNCNILIQGILEFLTVEIELLENEEVIFKYNSNNFYYNYEFRLLGIRSYTFISDLKLLDYSAMISVNQSKASPLGHMVGAVPDYDKELIKKLNFVMFATMNERAIKFDKEGNCEIKRKDNEYVSISRVGDGVKLFAVLDTLVKNEKLKRGSIILLDEPDNGLHTSLYKELLSKLKEIGCIVFLTTHNPIFINMMASDKDINHLYTYLENGELKIKEVTAYEASQKLDEVILSDFTDKELDGFDFI